MHRLDSQAVLSARADCKSEGTQGDTHTHDLLAFGHGLCQSHLKMRDALLSLMVAVVIFQKSQAILCKATGCRRSTAQVLSQDQTFEVKTLRSLVDMYSCRMG